MANTNIVFGYARISDSSQNEARQMVALREAGVDERHIYLDKQSGKNFNRPQYQILKNNLREGDLLIVQSIDRLGRNYKDILNEWKDITQGIRADIKVLDMNMLDTTLHKDLLGTFISDLILQVLAYVAQQERESIKSRQAEGISCAMQEGVRFGRPKVNKPVNFAPVYESWKNEEITAKKAMDELGLKRTTFYELVKEEAASYEADEVGKSHRTSKPVIYEKSK
jgi:DNA invertase Pin-like site-specific DNA recombinase